MLDEHPKDSTFPYRVSTTGYRVGTPTPAKPSRVPKIPEEVDSLHPSVVLARGRAGEMFMMRPPQFHAISTALISSEEMAALLDQHPKRPRFRYRLATRGYHLLHAVG